MELVFSDTQQTTKRTFGRADGHFTVGPLDAGRYELRVTTDRGELLHTEYVFVQPGQPPMDIRLQDRKPVNRPVSGVVSVHDFTKQRKTAMRLLLDAARLRERSKTEAAIAKYEEAIRTDPTFALAHHDLAVQYIHMKRPWDARRHLLAAIEIEPKLESAYTNLSIADIALGDPIAAEQSAGGALKLNSKNPKASYLKSISLYLQRKGPKPPPYAGSIGQ